MPVTPPLIALEGLKQAKVTTKTYALTKSSKPLFYVRESKMRDEVL